MYVHNSFTKRLRKISIFPTRFKEKLDYPKHSVAFYPHGYINTDFCLNNLEIEGDFEIFAKPC